MVLTVRSNGELVGRCVIQESALVEHLVAGFVVVGKSDLDLAVFDLSQRDSEGRASLLEIDGSSAGSGDKASESGQSKLHLCGNSDCGERLNVFGVVSANGCCDDEMRDGQLEEVNSYLYVARRLMFSGMALSWSESANDNGSSSSYCARLTLDMCA